MRQTRELGKKCIVGLAAVLTITASASAVVTGQWDFSGDLNATVGTALQYGDVTTQTNTSFGLTSAYVIPTIVPTDAGGTATGAAVNAQVMSFPKTMGTAQGYKMFPGAAANGALSPGDVNQYSMIWDVYFPAASNNKYRALLQTSATNANDADYFVGDSAVLPDANGLGISGVYNGTILPDTWYRIGLVVNLDAGTGNPTYFKYINGNLVGSQILAIDRWSIWSAASGNPSWILSDNDGDTEAGFVDHVRFYDSALSANDLGLLGGIKNGPVVPEPATLTLLGLGAAALLRRRRVNA